MLAVSAFMAVANVFLAALISIVLVGYGFRRLFQRRRGQTHGLGAATWFIPGSFGLIAALFTLFYDGRFRFEDASTVLWTLGAMLMVWIAAIVCSFKGWRGRRVGEHEHCRKCGFDLFGRPEGTRVCGECGAALDVQRATVIGERRRRPFLLATGLILFILAPATAGAILRESVRDIGPWASEKWLAAKPESWLLKNAATSRADENELTRRYYEGRLSDASIESYLDWGLGQTTGRGITGAYASEVRKEWRAGRVSEALLRKALQTTFNVQLVIGERAAPGECLRFLIRTDDYSLSRFVTRREGFPKNDIDVSNLRIVVNGREIDRSAVVDDPFGVPIPAFTLRDFGTRIDLKRLPELKPGDELKLELNFTLSSTIREPGKPDVTERRDLSLSGTSKVVAADQMHCTQLMRTVPDETDASQSRTEPASTDPAGFQIYLTRREGRTSLEVSRKRFDSFAGELLMRVDGQTTVLAMLVESSRLSTDIELDTMPPEDAEFFFRPDNALGVQLFAPLQTIQEEFQIPPDNVSRRDDP